MGRDSRLDLIGPGTCTNEKACTEEFLNELQSDITELMDELFGLSYTEDGSVGQKANNIRHKLIINKIMNRINSGKAEEQK